MPAPTLSRHVLRVAGGCAVLAALVAACGVDGGGGPVPPLPSDFAPGATVPGWVLKTPSGGRADVFARAAHDGARWTVILTREAARRPRDLWLSLAVADDGTSHIGVPLLRFTADPAAQPDSATLVARRVSNGQVVPDGNLAAGEWDPGSFSLLEAAPQNELPAGWWPPVQPAFVSAGAAFDAEYVYFVFQWMDPGVRKSDLGPLLLWDGTQWTRRPHAANDTDGNGVLGPSEPMTFGAPAEDEDRLMLFFPVHDRAAAFTAQGSGCAATCHGNLALDPTGGEALHAALCPDDVIDVWSWRAASTAPARRANDGHLVLGAPAAGLSGGGSGFRDDTGNGAFEVQDPSAPTRMFVSPPQGHEPLVGETLLFAAGTTPGFPVLPAVTANAAPYDPLDFNHTGQPPQTWTGSPPFFGNDFLPPFVQGQPSESAADVEAGSTYAGGLWTVELRRRRITRDATGAPRPDDVQFEDDADFAREALEVLASADGLPFSISITDNATGHGVRESRYEGPLLLSADPSLQGGSHGGALFVHDYGPGFAPQDAAAFTDTTATRPVPDAGPDPDLELKAGTDGGPHLFVLATWTDPAPQTGPDRWTWDGFRWLRSGGQDELRFLWNVSAPPSSFVASRGCASFCHGSGGPFDAPQAPHFSSDHINHTADLWRWQAGRTAPLDAADDLALDWRFFGLEPQATSRAALHGDGGSAAFEPNFRTGQGFPEWMAAADPNADVPFLGFGVPGLPLAVPFLDVSGGLPPKPGGGGGGGVSFAAEVLPIFQARCISCHGGGSPQGGLSLESLAGLLAGGNSGPAVVPGNPSASLLVKRITGQIPPQMPLGGPALSQEQITTISTWIEQGTQP